MRDGNIEVSSHTTKAVSFSLPMRDGNPYTSMATDISPTVLAYL